ncbi:MAG: hypothetical protein H6618_05425 [Deltaproteobacteria bacterium]|nr:hypothetical protein [Deltaproteobacteria bacterium]
MKRVYFFLVLFFTASQVFAASSQTFADRYHKALRDAIQAGNLNKLKEIFTEAGDISADDLNYQDPKNKNRTLLHEVAAYLPKKDNSLIDETKMDMYFLLLSKGLKPEIKDSERKKARQLWMECPDDKRLNNRIIVHLIENAFKRSTEAYHAQHAKNKDIAAQTDSDSDCSNLLFTTVILGMAISVPVAYKLYTMAHPTTEVPSDEMSDYDPLFPDAHDPFPAVITSPTPADTLL